jgi:hypothetical protein
MQEGQGTGGKAVFQTSALFMAVFYGVLLFWTVGTVPLIYQKFLRGGFGGDWPYALMIGFFYLYTWFWALGLFYRIVLDDEGRIQLKSLRRTLEISAKQIRAIEGSRFSGGFGFVRFKLPRESGYLFCHSRNHALDEILGGIRKMNPLLRTVRI